MAAGKLGMNTDEVRRLAKSLQNDSDTLSEIAQQITQTLNGVFWRGADAERFRADWNSAHKPDLKSVALALEGFGLKAATNANEQDSTSN